MTLVLAERLLASLGTQGSGGMPWQLKAPWSDSVLSGVGLDVSRFSTSSQQPEFTSVATAVLVIAVCAGLLRLFDRLPHLKPWRWRNPPLSSVAELRKRLRPPRVAAPVVPLVLPSTCTIVPGTVETQAAVDPAGVDPQVTPALVLVNRKSGGHTGEVLLSCFSDLLNPLQVWDLSDGGPRDALALFRRVPNLRVLACGGDGTIGWVAEAMRDANLAPGAALCPVPLGTGNDFARALGWGGGFDGDTLASVGRLLNTIAAGYTSYIDRWQIAQVSPPEHTTVTVGRTPHSKTVAITEAHLAAEGTDEGLFLHWDFRTQDHDIAFEVVFIPDGSSADKEPRVVFARQRLAAHKSPMVGKLQVEHAGTFKLRWDNSYSRLRRKHLMHRVWLSSTSTSTPSSNSQGRTQISMTTEARTAEAMASGARSFSEVGMTADSVKRLVMNNYLGIGVDAEVTLAFHRLRVDNPKLFSNRIINKIGYLWIGAKLSLRRYIYPATCGDLGDKVRLFADGKRVDLPAGLSGIIILNLPSFGGGLDMWVPQSGQEWSPQSINDGRVEVIGVNSSLDIALQGGLAGLGMQVAVRLAQARAVRLELKSHVPCSDEGGSEIAVQCDGEPWLSSPGSAIAVASTGHTPVVRPRIHEGHDVVRIVDDVILQATRDGLIGEEQRVEIALRLAARLPS
eukprot:COSAG02_NODE_321_length_24780_cov_11.623962_16_plen_679_part_00